MKQFLIVVTACVSLLLCSCGTQNKFASSFGKRHYTKGFYVDVPALVQAKAGGKAKHSHTAKVFVEVPVHSEIPTYYATIDAKPALTYIHKPKHIVKNAVSSPRLQTAIQKTREITSHRFTKSSPDESNNENATLTLISVGLMLLAIITLLLALSNGFEIANAMAFIFFIVSIGSFIGSLITGVCAIVQHHDHFGLAVFAAIIDALVLGFFLILPSLSE